MMHYKEAFYKVFEVNAIHNGWPFHEGFTCGLVMYPTEVMTPYKWQFNRIVEFIRDIGESGFWITNVEVYKDDFVSEENTTWFDINQPYDDFNNIFWAVTMHALYSESARWGILLTTECYALIGSTKNIFEKFQKHYPEWKTDLSDFSDDLYKKNPDASMYDIFPRRLGIWKKCPEFLERS